MASVRDHSTPKADSMPRYGGRPVTALKAGTDKRPRIPVTKTSWPLGANSVPVVSLGGTKASAGTCVAKAPTDNITETIEGKNSPVMVGRAEIWPLIQSIVVVTSPMGI
jgi:hypothetical protein